MGFGLILAGIFFLFNPCINIIDLVPDTIGYLLISAGLYKLADTEERFFTARHNSNILAAICAVKLILSLVIPARWHDGLLPATFVFGVLEIIFGVLFCVSFYGGIEYMANLHDGGRHLSKIGSVSQISIIFVILKNVLAFLPESFALFKQNDIDLSYHKRRIQTLAEFKNYAVLLFCVIVLIAGIYYLVLNFGLLNGIRRDKSFCGGLYDIYKERVLDNKKLMASRRFKRYFVLVIVGSLLMYDLIIDCVNITPDILSCAAFLAAYFVMVSDKGKRKKQLCLFIPLAAVSVGCAVFRFFCEMGVCNVMNYESYFFDRFMPVENGTAIPVMTVLSLADAVLFVLFCRNIFRDASDEFENVKAKGVSATLSYAIPTVLIGIYAALSAAINVAPLLTARYYSLYRNDSVIYAGFDKISRTCDAVHNILYIALVAVTFITLLYFFRKKADTERDI